MHLNDICSDRDSPIYDVLLVHTSQQHSTVDIAPMRSTLGTTAQVERDTDTKLYTKVIFRTGTPTAVKTQQII
jgi:hypothetical protein